MMRARSRRACVMVSQEAAESGQADGRGPDSSPSRGSCSSCSSPSSSHSGRGLWPANCSLGKTGLERTITGQLSKSDTSSQDTNLRFFGAHTLTVKISRDWTALDEEHWLPLRDALLGWLTETARLAYPLLGQPGASGERIVLRKLAVAVGQYALRCAGALETDASPQTTSLSFRMAPQLWDSWLGDVIAHLTAGGCSQTGVYEVLALVIEEVGRADLVGARR